ncbi:MAG: hypothetical protein AAGI01_14050 [Myxococcota bacterium]
MHDVVVDVPFALGLHRAHFVSMSGAPDEEVLADYFYEPPTRFDGVVLGGRALEAVGGVTVQIIGRGPDGTERVVGEAVSRSDGTFSVLLGQ